MLAKYLNTLTRLTRLAKGLGLVACCLGVIGLVACLLVISASGGHTRGGAARGLLVYIAVRAMPLGFNTRRGFGFVCSS